MFQGKLATFQRDTIIFSLPMSIACASTAGMLELLVLLLLLFFFYIFDKSVLSPISSYVPYFPHKIVQVNWHIIIPFLICYYYSRCTSFHANLYFTRNPNHDSQTQPHLIKIIAIHDRYAEVLKIHYINVMMKFFCTDEEDEFQE